MTRFSVVYILSVILVLVVLPTESHSGSATVHISARVLPWASMNVQQHTTSYQVGPEDITRGYVDVPSTATVDILTNTSEINLSLLSLGGARGLIGAAGDHKFGSRLWVSLTAEELHLRHAFQVIDVRVLLDTESQPGTHALVIKLGIDAI